MNYSEFLYKVYDVLKDRWVPESLKTKGYEFKTTWSLGGTSGSCFKDSPTTVAPQPRPSDASSELDLILEAVCPTMSFIQYKNLCNEVVKTGEDYERDYYGGSTTEAYEKFATQDLYDALNKRGLLE